MAPHTPCITSITIDDDPGTFRLGPPRLGDAGGAPGPARRSVFRGSGLSKPRAWPRRVCVVPRDDAGDMPRALAPAAAKQAPAPAVARRAMRCGPDGGIQNIGLLAGLATEASAGLRCIGTSNSADKRHGPRRLPVRRTGPALAAHRTRRAREMNHMPRDGLRSPAPSPASPPAVQVRQASALRPGKLVPIPLCSHALTL